MITVESKVGRVIEVRFAEVLTPKEMQDMRTPLSAAVVRIGVDVIFVVDFRTCGALSTDVLPMMLGLMRSDNRKIQKSAHLFESGSAVAEQMKSAIATAGNASRRMVFSVSELTDWLSDIATPQELDTTKAFFAQVE